MLVHQHVMNSKGKYDGNTKKRLNNNHNCCGTVVNGDSNKQRVLVMLVCNSNSSICLVLSSGKSNAYKWVATMRARPIQVNAIEFESARAAARYIVEQEEKLGNVRKENTIAKELKRCWQGACWYMYERWLVTQVMIGVEAETEGRVPIRYKQ